MSEPILAVSKLCKNFGGLRALSEIDFQVGKNTISSIIGPNGAGKSTLFNVITGFQRPSSGEIRFEGRKIARTPPYRLARFGIGRTFQTTSYFGERNVEENLLMAGYSGQRAQLWDVLSRSRRFRREEAEVRDKARSIMEFLGIAKFQEEMAGRAPTGVKQMLAIGMALMTEPRLLLLDEPCGGLTHEEVGLLMDVIGRIREQGTAILLIEHRMRVVMAMSEHIMVLNFGEKIAEGSPEEIRRNNRVIEAYLGKEYVI